MTTDFEQQLNNQTAVFKMDTDFLQQGKGIPISPSTMSSNHMSLPSQTNDATAAMNSLANNPNACDPGLMHQQQQMCQSVGADSLYENRVKSALASIQDAAIANLAANVTGSQQQQQQQSLLDGVHGNSRLTNDAPDNMLRDNSGGDLSKTNTNNNNNGLNANDDNNNNNNNNNTGLNMQNNLCANSIDATLSNTVHELNVLTSVLNSQMQLAVQQQQQQANNNQNSMVNMHQNNQQHRLSPSSSMQQSNQKLSGVVGQPPMSPTSNDNKQNVDKLNADLQVFMTKKTHTYKNDFF